MVGNVNLLLILVLVLMLVIVVTEYDRGMVKAIISFMTLAVICVMSALIANGIVSYHDGKILNVILVIILLVVMGAVQYLLNVVFFSAKLLAKLQVASFVDKLLGILFGILETVLILWTLYIFVMLMDLGMFSHLIKSGAAENPVLSWLYQHNYLAHGLGMLLSKFSFVPLTLS